MSGDLQATSAVAPMLRRAMQNLTERGKTVEVGRYLVLDVRQMEYQRFTNNSWGEYRRRSRKSGVEVRKHKRENDHILLTQTMQSFA